MTVTPNERRWLDTVCFAEGTWDPNRGGCQYDMMFGGGRFKDFSRHPDVVNKAGGLASAAAGAYQFMPGTWESVGGGAMTPDRQDQAALRLIRNRGVDPATEPIDRYTVAALSPEFASFPKFEGGSYYPEQNAKSFESIQRFAQSRGAEISQNQSSRQDQQPQSNPETEDEKFARDFADKMAIAVGANLIESMLNPPKVDALQPPQVEIPADNSEETERVDDLEERVAAAEYRNRRLEEVIDSMRARQSGKTQSIAEAMQAALNTAISAYGDGPKSVI